MPVPVRPSQPHTDRPRPEPNNKIHTNFIIFSRYLTENMVRVLWKDQQVNTAEETHKQAVGQNGEHVTTAGTHSSQR